MVNAPLARRGAVLLLVVLLLTVLAACRQQVPVTPEPSVPADTQEPGSTQPESPQTEVPPAVPQPQVGSSTYDKTFSTGDGAKILTLSYAMPKIENTDGYQSLCAINAYYETQLQNLVDAGESALLDMAETAAQDGKLFVPYSDEETFTEEYRTSSHISFLRVRNNYTGGAHPNLELSADNFDYTTGLRLTAVDLFAVPEDTYRTRILDEILKQIEQGGADNYFEGYQEILPHMLNPDQFYLTDEGVVFFFQPYDLAPYAAGTPSFLIPYSTLEDILTPWT